MLLALSFLSLLWLALHGQRATGAVGPTDITVTNLTAQHFPELGSRRVNVAYGSHVVQSRATNDGMSHFNSAIAPPCTDCLVTFMQAQLEYANGTIADASTGMWMHHVVFVNQGQEDSSCPNIIPAQRFFASGNERTAVDFTSTFSAQGTQHLGYSITANESFFVTGELMNMLDTPQEVVFSMIWEFIPSPPPYFKHVTPYWLDVGGCGDSDVPARSDEHFAYTSPVVNVSFHAEIALIGGHLHDGGTHLDVVRNGMVVCTTEATYSEASISTDGIAHITRIQSCLNAGRFTPGDQWSIKAHYDTVMHPPMAANDGTLEPVMGIALVYVVPSDPIRVGWLSRNTLIYIVVSVVMLTGLAALYVVRQKGDLVRQLWKRPRHRGWQRVQASDPPIDGDDPEDGHLLHDHEQLK